MYLTQYEFGLYVLDRVCDHVCDHFIACDRLGRVLTAYAHGALAGFIDPGTAQHNYVANDDFVLVTRNQEMVALPRNADARTAFEAIQRQVNRLLFGLELGTPIPITGVIDGTTVNAVKTIADSDKTVRSNKNHFIPDIAQTPLRDIGMLGLLRQNPLDVQRQLATRARLWASVLGVLADTVWWSTRTNLPPCPMNATSSRLAFVAVGALGVLVGAVAVFAILER